MYTTIRRWHFYAGLFCVLFILLLSLTGSFYLFKPQIESYLDRPYEGLALAGARKTAAEQVAAALAAVPGSVLNSYQLPATPRSAVQVLVGRGTELYRIYVHPETLAILKRESEDGRLMQLLFHLHGELLLGDGGSMVVELAASWAIVMIITGLYLWWPRSAQGLAGLLYPRLGNGRRVFWRDLHAVTGVWISLFVLFLLVSGLPWAKSWGGMLKELRQMGTTVTVKQDWTTGRSSELGIRQAMNRQGTALSEHAGHHHATEAINGNKDYSIIDRLIEAVGPLHLAPPVLISPPSQRSPDWTARSEAQNRPLRVNLVLDADTGAIKSRQDFADRPLLDRIIGVGVAAHEGQLFGWPNQALGILTAMGLWMMTISSVVLWWKRRLPGTLGAPPINHVRPSLSRPLIAVIVTFGVLLPLFGISMVVIVALDRWVLPHIPTAQKYLGLTDSNEAAVRAGNYSST
jgi:uncharacterized iron-regulated membrane protein